MDELLEPGTRIKVDMSDVADFHHREHHMRWITIRGALTGNWGHRYECVCPHGYSLWAEPHNIRATRAAR